MFLSVLWNYIAIASPYLLLGILIAGLFHNFLSVETIKKHLGGKSVGSIFKAALIGIPLPLCSCSVLPSAVTLRKSGASNGATSAFLISTPETGVDSILVTYGLMGLPMAIIRPVVSFITATTVGLFQHWFNKFEYVEEQKVTETNCGKEEGCCCASKPAPAKPGIVKMLIETVRYSTTTMLQDIAFWLTLGLVLGAVIEFIVPVDFFNNVSGPFGRLIVLFIGIPFYICASASTPIAVSMMMKGMSPGTALILLLVGPATNISTFLVMQKYIGNKGIAINIFVLAAVSYLFSFVVDALFSTFHWGLPMMDHAHNHGEHLSLFSHICGVIFTALLLKALWTEEIAPRLKFKKG